MQYKLSWSHPWSSTFHNGSLMWSSFYRYNDTYSYCCETFLVLELHFICEDQSHISNMPPAMLAPIQACVLLLFSRKSSSHRLNPCPGFAGKLSGIFEDLVGQISRGGAVHYQSGVGSMKTRFDYLDHKYRSSSHVVSCNFLNRSCKNQIQLTPFSEM